MTFYSSDADEADPAAWLSNIHGSYDETAGAFAAAPADVAVAVLDAIEGDEAS